MSLLRPKITRYTHPYCELFPIRFAFVPVENQWMNTVARHHKISVALVACYGQSFRYLVFVCVHIYMCIVCTVQVLFSQFPSVDPRLNSFHTVPTTYNNHSSRAREGHHQILGCDLELSPSPFNFKTSVNFSFVK